MSTNKTHLDHHAYDSLLRRAEEYKDRDWTKADRFERHAINAALDLRDARATIAEQVQRITQLETRLALADALASDLLASLQSGYLFGNYDEPLDGASKRIVRVIHQRTTAYRGLVADRREQLLAELKMAFLNLGNADKQEVQLYAEYLKKRRT